MGRRNRRYRKRKYCAFCANDNLTLDYKNPKVLKDFITDRGKIIPSRISGTCSTHQRFLTREIKKARMVALIPFTAKSK